MQRYYLDRSEEEIARSLEAPAGTIKWLLRSARIRLRAMLGPDFFWPQVVTAMSRLLGFIPGMGVVESERAILVLAEPVVAECDEWNAPMFPAYLELVLFIKNLPGNLQAGC